MKSYIKEVYRNTEQITNCVRSFSGLDQNG